MRGRAGRSQGSADPTIPRGFLVPVEGFRVPLKGSLRVPLKGSIGFRV